MDAREKSNPIPGFGREGPMFTSYNNETPTDVYESMASGKAQVNAMSDYLQDSEKDMKSNSKIFDGYGVNLGYELPYIELVGPNDSAASSNVSMNKKTDFEQYMTSCKIDEDNESCLKRVFDCDPDRPWKECELKLEPCKDDFTGKNICKYNTEGTLLKKYTPLPKPPIEEKVQMLRIG